jgi:hypothetical protein
MKIKDSDIRTVIKEEIQRLSEDISKDEESKIAHLIYILLTEARKKFDEYLAELPEEEDPSEEFSQLYDAVSDAWRTADEILTGGETRDALPNIFGDMNEELSDDSDCSGDTISEAMDIIIRCVMTGTAARPKSTETELGVVPKNISAPPAGTKSKRGNIKFVGEDQNDE